EAHRRKVLSGPARIRACECRQCAERSRTNQRSVVQCSALALLHVPQRVLFAVIAAFVLSRTMVFVLVLVGSHMSFLGKDYGNTIWRTESTIARQAGARANADERRRVVVSADCHPGL